jgi:hypothetical protein
MKAIATRWSIFPEIRIAGFTIDQYPAGFPCLSGESPSVCKSGPAKIPFCYLFPDISGKFTVEHLVTVHRGAKSDALQTT